jgi:tetratricopeptide (TPR) repeat protein
MNKYLAIIIFLFAAVSFLPASELEDIFQDAVTAFENKEYETSLNLFLSIENEDIQNPDLFYNIGNCYFRLNKFGKAILYYKRALKFDPTHKSSKRNLEFVLTFTQDKQLEDEPDLISSLWLKLRNSLSLNMAAVIVLCLFMINIILIMMIITKFRNRDKTSLVFTLTIALIFLMFFSAVSLIKWKNFTSDTEAVLIKTSAIGYSGPGEEFTRVFTIHEGMIFEIEKTETDWSLIKLPNGLGGWIKKNNYLKI